MQIEKQKENDIYIKRELITAASVLLPACMMLFVESMARGSVKLTIDWIVANPMVAFINYAVWFIPFNLFQFISRRWLFWTCQLILTGLVLCIGVGNAVKLQVRTTPFVLQDLSVLDAAVTMAEDYFPEWNLPLLLVCAVLAVVAFAIVVGRRFNRYAVGKTRWVLFSMIFCCMLFYTTEKDAFWAEGYSLKNNYENNGFADGFLRSAAENYNAAKKPQGYSSLAVEDAIKNADIQEIPMENIRPNVVVVLGESFMDTDFLSGVNFTRDPIPTVHRTMQDFTSGYVTVNVQGGGTNFSESQVLTGLKECNYSMLATEQRCLPSLATVLKAEGYVTHALHTYHGWFYNRYDAMKLMGFDEFICQSTFLTNTPSYGVWPCDSSLYDETFDVLNETAGSDFCYLATMESHGSYNYDMEHGDWFINDFSSESEQYLNTYFNVLSDADKALGEFLDKLSNWDEPTVVLFFGDHIPSLGEKTYQEIAFDTASPEGFMTPYFIWSNYGLTVKHENMPIQRLGAHTLTQLGLNSDPYLSLIEHTAAGSDEAQIASDLLAYDLLYGKQHYLEITGQDLSNPNYRIGHEVELESAEVFQIEGTLFIVPNGRNLSICSDLVINDHAYPLSNSGLGWSAAVPVDALPADGAEFQIAVRIRDSKDTVISQSNEISVVIDQETAKQAGDAKKQGLENSLIIDSIYPGTEITSEMLKPDGSLDIGVSSPEIAATTVIYVDGVELHTFYGDTFISATIPAEMMLDGTVEVQLFNRILQKYSDAVVLQVWHE